MLQLVTIELSILLPYTPDIVLPGSTGVTTKIEWFQPVLYFWTGLANHNPIQIVPKLVISVMQKVEHIGIAVKSLEASVPLFERLLNTQCYKTEEVESEKVNTAFFRQGDTKIELVEGLDPDGVIARFIEKKGEGLHHIAFEVTDIEVEMDRLKKEGFVLLNSIAKPGADDKLVCFLHPKHTNSVLIELCMSVNTSSEERKK